MNTTRFKSYYSALVKRLSEDELSEFFYHHVTFTITDQHYTRVATRMEKLVYQIVHRAIAFAQYRTKEPKKVPAILLADLKLAWLSVQNDSNA